MQISYRQEGDYLVPNLTLPPEEKINLGKYARLRKRYLKEHRPILYTNLFTSGKLNQHLAEIELTANERMEQITKQMATQYGVPESLKAADQMVWVGAMNNIRQAAEEITLHEIIYA